MVFASLIFLFAFLPLTLALYYAVPAGSRRLRNLILLGSSYLFYFWGSGPFLIALILSTLSDYILALLIDRYPAKATKRVYLSVSILLNLSMLGYFKYSNFFVDEFNSIGAGFGLAPFRWTSIVLPIGISFFTFQKITYSVDVYRGTKKALKSFIDYALYVAMFPQLIAGPIVRFHEISDQLEGRVETFDGFYRGVVRFSLGLAKKVLIANICAEVADAVFAQDPSALNTPIAWVGLFAYTMQIYFDFSAYTDMAIGLGHIFGFTLPENFKRPYSAVSITDFWRRWHITLSNFFRDYLYIPLGGARAGRTRLYLNLIIVFVLCGLWHGANTTFLVWGLLHGTLLVLERALGLRGLDNTSFVTGRRALTLFLVMLGWVFFRSQSLTYAVDYLNVMFVPSAKVAPIDVTLALSYRNLILTALAGVVIFLPRDFSLSELMERDKGVVMNIVQTCAIIVALIYSTAFLASGSYNPFIYFQF